MIRRGSTVGKSNRIVYIFSMNVISRILIVVFALIFALHVTADSSQKKKKSHAVREHPTAAVNISTAPKVNANYGKYEFTFTTLDGKNIHLSDYAGKVVLVNIWAPWCGPCRVETPGFIELYQRYKPKGFEVLGVAVQTNESDVRSFMGKLKIPWPVGIKDEVAKAYGTYGLPDNYLFNPDGSLAKRFIGYTREDMLTSVLVDALKRIPAKSP
ncbi:MAG: TlpA family protein disulfide reductase [Ignavibacteria bacterium]|nr:TlpA family protein disulfide reductase [Ignavibacteria bacterium]